MISLDLEDADLEAKTLLVLGNGRLQKETLSVPMPTRTILTPWISVRGLWESPMFANPHYGSSVPGIRLSTTSLYRIIRDLGKQTG
ncbi:hypothetical protein ACFL2Q_13390 [Thermodesulfobacteriota bacterium]